MAPTEARYCLRAAMSVGESARRELLMEALRRVERRLRRVMLYADGDGCRRLYMLNIAVTRRRWFMSADE